MAQINLNPFEDKEKFVELSTFWIEKQLSGTKNKNFERIQNFLYASHSQITGGHYGSFRASFGLFIHYNWPELEKYTDLLAGME